MSSTNSPSPLLTDSLLASEIIQANPIPTIVLDANHIVTHWNKAMEILSGISGQEMIGTSNHWMGFYATPRPIMADMVLFEAAASRIADLYGGKFRSSTLKPGSWEGEDFFPQLGFLGKWLYFTAAPIIDAQGKLIGAIETIQDVTEKRIAEDKLRQSEEEFRRISGHDCLTNLKNSRSYKETIESELYQMHRYQEPFSLILLDIDNFKQVNDTFGHPSGDEVIKALANILRDSVRKNDIPCRLGGEEFAVVVPRCRLEAASALAERIRYRFEKQWISALSGESIHCTVSLGITQATLDDNTLTLYQRADKALYASKNNGKNQVTQG